MFDISYLRVSTARQRDEETIETQRFALDRHFAANRLRIPAALRFEDDGVSGGVEIHQRPAGKKVYDLVASGRVRTLYLFHSDRVGRDTIDTLLFHRLATSHGTRIVGVADGTDTAREGHDLTTEIRAVIAAEYRRDCSRRTRAGLRRRAAAGLVSCHPPFGYVVSDGRLALDPERAEVMRRNFADYAAGMTGREVVARRRAEGAASPRGKGWRHDTLLYLLKHRAYIGEFEVFRRRDPITIECPALVAPEMFAAVQSLIKTNFKGGHSPKHFYLLRGLVKCDTCGRSYVGHRISGRRYKDKRYPDFVYYECGTLTNSNYGYCGNPRLNAARLDALVWARVADLLSRPADFLDRLAAKARCEAGGAARKLSELRRRAEKNRAARERLALAVARGVLSDEDAALGVARLSEECARIAAEESRITAERPPRFDVAEVFARLRASIVAGIEPRAKREIICTLVREIRAGRDGRGKIVFHFRPAPSSGTVASAFPDAAVPQLTFSRPYQLPTGRAS